jgi:CRISPR/Cas system CMR-associated protein Cmr1 (group 7 of RAMP superfamily)
MISLTFPLELITPCLAAGAEPERQAEIRATAVRGQLRWWFGALGGFASLNRWLLADQEQILFGPMNRNERRMGKLIVRVVGSSSTMRSHRLCEANTLGGPDPGHPANYLAFPLQSPRKRALFFPPLPQFTLQLTWRGTLHPWTHKDQLERDLTALATVFGHLGSLGFRSRRALGALAPLSPGPDLQSALNGFLGASALVVKQLAARSGEDAVSVLAQWLRKWRSYGRTAGQRFNSFKPGFQFAKNDHDAGLQRQVAVTYRPAIGLPIVQHYSSNGATVYWNPSRSQRGEIRGRFPSPVLLRPYRKSPHQWQALVIFVNSQKWPTDRQVYVDGHPRAVSLDLYEAMQKDPALQPFLEFPASPPPSS